MYSKRRIKETSVGHHFNVTTVSPLSVLFRTSISFYTVNIRSFLLLQPKRNLFSLSSGHPLPLRGDWRIRPRVTLVAYFSREGSFKGIRYLPINTIHETVAFYSKFSLTSCKVPLNWAGHLHFPSTAGQMPRTVILIQNSVAVELKTATKVEIRIFWAA